MKDLASHAVLILGQRSICEYGIKTLGKVQMKKKDRVDPVQEDVAMNIKFEFEIFGAAVFQNPSTVCFPKDISMILENA